MALAAAAAEAQRACGLDVTAESFIEATLNFNLMEVVYEWAKGTSFEQICQVRTGLTNSMLHEEDGTPVAPALPAYSASEYASRSLLTPPALSFPSSLVPHSSRT